MGAQQGKEVGGGGGRVGAGGNGALPPGQAHVSMPAMAGRVGERQASRIKGLRPPKQRTGANIFTEHSGEYNHLDYTLKQDRMINLLCTSLCNGSEEQLSNTISKLQLSCSSTTK